MTTNFVVIDTDVPAQARLEAAWAYKKSGPARLGFGSGRGFWSGSDSDHEIFILAMQLCYKLSIYYLMINIYLHSTT